MVIAKKKDGIDYRNWIELDWAGYLGDVDFMMQKRSEDKYFSKTDLVPDAPGNTYKISFVTQDEQYGFLTMPFGMVDSSATLIRGLGKIMNGIQHTD